MVTKRRSAIDGVFATTTDLINYAGTWNTNDIVVTDGFLSVGDGGGAKWKLTGNTIAASQTPALTGNATLSDANGNEFELVENGAFINVLVLGAFGDGLTDNLAVFNAVWSSCISSSKSMLIPGGSYLLSGEFVADYTSYTIETDESGPDIIGAGRGVAEIKGSFGGNLIKVLGTQTGAGFHVHATISGLKLTSTGGVGIFHKNGAFTNYRDLFFIGCQDGFIGEDILSCHFEGVRARSNVRGMTFRTTTGGSEPNAITLTACHVGWNSEYGVLNDGGSNFVIDGGSIEGNGTTSGASGEYGVKMNSNGKQGATGLTMSGVYCEGNAGLADVWINSGIYDCSHSIVSCNFNRINAAKFCTNNIRVQQSDASGHGVPVVTVSACSFQNFNDYTPNPARDYIGYQSDSAAIYTSGNLYGSDTEKPTLILDGTSFAGAFFNGTLTTPITATRVRNIDVNITKVATGRYTLNFNKGAPTPLTISGNVNGNGYIEKFAETSTSITFNTKNSITGVVTDYSQVFVEIGS